MPGMTPELEVGGGLSEEVAFGLRPSEQEQLPWAGTSPVAGGTREGCEAGVEAGGGEHSVNRPGEHRGLGAHLGSARLHGLPRNHSEHSRQEKTSGSPTEAAREAQGPRGECWGQRRQGIRGGGEKT